MIMYFVIPGIAIIVLAQDKWYFSCLVFQVLILFSYVHLQNETMKVCITIYKDC